MPQILERHFGRRLWGNDRLTLQNGDTMPYSETSGHLSVMRGAPLITDIQWNQSEEFSEVKKRPHILHGVKTQDDRYYELYMLMGSLPLHTDFPLWKETRTLGLIVEAGEDAYLTSGPRRLSLRPGDVYRIDPNKRHGVLTSGFFVFIARDYPAGREPDPYNFKMNANDWLRAYLDAAQYSHQICEQN